MAFCGSPGCSLSPVDLPLIIRFGLDLAVVPVADAEVAGLLGLVGLAGSVAVAGFAIVAPGCGLAGLALALGLEVALAFSHV